MATLYHGWRGVDNAYPSSIQYRFVWMIQILGSN